MEDKKPKIRADEWLDLGIGIIIVTAFVGACLFCDDTRDFWDKVLLVIMYFVLLILLYFQYK